VATEEGFDHYTYAATTDEKGWFDLAVPAVDLLFALTPPAGDAAVTFVDVATGEFPAIIMLDEGDAISGVVVHKEAGVAYALIEVRNSRDQLYATTLTDEGGSFAVRVHWDGTREATRAPDARGGSGR
jgi:hypothetical protein